MGEAQKKRTNETAEGATFHEPFDVGHAAIRFEKLKEDLGGQNASALGDSPTRTGCGVRNANSWLEHPDLLPEGSVPAINLPCFFQKGLQES